MCQKYSRFAKIACESCVDTEMKTMIIECHTVLTMIASCMRRHRNCSSDKPPDRVLINNADATCAGQAPIVTRFNDMHVRRWQQANNAFSGRIDTAFIAVALLISYCYALAAGLMDAWQLEYNDTRVGNSVQRWWGDWCWWVDWRLLVAGVSRIIDHISSPSIQEVFSCWTSNWLSYQYSSAT